LPPTFTPSSAVAVSLAKTIQSTALDEACKQGNLRGAGQATFAADGKEYGLWIEDLTRSASGWRAGYTKLPSAK
jgi:hypothetical protein